MSDDLEKFGLGGSSRNDAMPVAVTNEARSSLSRFFTPGIYVARIDSVTFLAQGAIDITCGLLSASASGRFQAAGERRSWVISLMTDTGVYKVKCFIAAVLNKPAQNVTELDAYNIGTSAVGKLLRATATTKTSKRGRSYTNVEWSPL